MGIDLGLEQLQLGLLLVEAFHVDFIDQCIDFIRHIIELGIHKAEFIGRRIGNPGFEPPQPDLAHGLHQHQHRTQKLPVSEQRIKQAKGHRTAQNADGPGPDAVDGLHDLLLRKQHTQGQAGAGGLVEQDDAVLPLAGVGEAAGIFRFARNDGLERGQVRVGLGGEQLLRSFPENKSGAPLPALQRLHPGPELGDGNVYGDNHPVVRLDPGAPGEGKHGPLLPLLRGEGLGAAWAGLHPEKPFFIGHGNISDEAGSVLFNVAKTGLGGELAVFVAQIDGNVPFQIGGVAVKLKLAQLLHIGPEMLGFIRGLVDGVQLAVAGKGEGQIFKFAQSGLQLAG
ncbi:hypothetical protein D3C75_547460 [compost metagenome]